jgi:predicted permease
MRRLLRNHTRYVALVTFVIAVSIGVNLIVFTVVNALWIRPLPFPAPDRLVTLPGVPFVTLDLPELKIFGGGVAGQVDTQDRFAADRLQIELVGQRPETLAVTAAYFRVLGLIIRGRDFTSADEQAAAEPVAIISDRFWSNSFGRKADLVGRVISATPFPVRIVGIAPRGFHGAFRGEDADVWVPFSLVGRRSGSGSGSGVPPMTMLARLSAGQTPAEMAQRIEAINPEIPRLFHATITPLNQLFRSGGSAIVITHERSPLFVVSALALLVLLGGCATIAALVLTHYERRRDEFALKMALGADRPRLLRQVASELSVVGMTGNVGGLLVAILGVSFIPALRLAGGVDIGRLDLSMDWRVMTVATSATITSLIAAAALPIARLTRVQTARQLMGRGATTTLASLRARQTLVAVQVCATTIVLISAGLFVRTVVYSLGGGAGFDVDRTVFVSIQFPSPRGTPRPDPLPIMAERQARLTPILEGLPGVERVAYGMAPIGREASAPVAYPQIVAVGNQERRLRVGFLPGSPGVLSTLGVPLMSGRGLTAADQSSVPHPVVITRALADELWPAGGALGQTFRIATWPSGQLLVVGIAGDLAFGSMTLPIAGVVVTTGPGGDAITSHFILRTQQPKVTAALARRAVQGEGDLVQVATGREIVANDIGRQRLGAWFFSGFGVAALILAVGGAFGLVAYLAESQRREFGVRLALGASMRHLIIRAVVTAVSPVAVGVAGGIVLGLFVSRLLGGFLVGIQALDPSTYLSVAAAMIVCPLLAALAAAWRLRATTPSDALRTN